MPTLVVVAVLVPFFGFYVARVNKAHNYLHTRGFKLLDLAGKQLESEIAGMKATMESAHKVALVAENDGRKNPEKELRAYLRRYLHDAETDSMVFHPRVGKHGNDFGVSLALRPVKPAGLLMAWGEPGAKEDHLNVHVPFTNVASRLLPGGAREFFEFIVVATDDGTVLGSAGDSDLHFTQLDALLKQAKPAQPPSQMPAFPGSNSSTQPPKSLSTPDVASGQQRFITQFNGDEYALFLEPTSIRLPVELNEKAAKTKTPPEPAKAAQVLIGGLARVSVLEEKAATMPTGNSVGVFLCLIALLVLCWPPLKLATMSPKERLRSGSRTALAMAVLAAIGALTGLYLSYGFHLSLAEEAEASLRDLSSELRTNFNNEVQASVGMLKASTTGYKPPAGDLQTFSSIPSIFDDQQPTKFLNGYPFFSHLYGVKPTLDGYVQEWKLSAEWPPTPLIALTPSGMVAVDVLKQKKLKIVSGGGVDEFGLQTISSPTTGEYLTIVAVKEAQGDGVRMTATRLMSLRNPVIREGYHFAVVDRDGGVLYHSESFRNGRENFLDECRNPENLKPLLGGQTPDSGRAVRLEYGGGAGIRAWVTPLAMKGGLKKPGIDGLDWTLITYREADADMETVFQAGLIQLSLVGTFLIAGGSFFLAAFGLWRVAVPLARSLESERRFWPRRRDRHQYISEIAVISVASLIILVLMVLMTADLGHGLREFLPVLLLLVWLAGVIAWIASMGNKGERLCRRPAALVRLGVGNMTLTGVFALRCALLIFYFVVCGNLASFPSTVQALHVLKEVRTKRAIDQQLKARDRAADEAAKRIEIAEFAGKRKEVTYDLAAPRGESLSLQGWLAQPLMHLALPIVSARQQGWPQSVEGWDTASAVRPWFPFPARWQFLFMGLFLLGMLYQWVHFVFERFFVHSFEDPRWQNPRSPDELAIMLKNSRRLLVFTHPQAHSTATVQRLADELRKSGELKVNGVIDLTAKLSLDDTAWAGLVAETKAAAPGSVLIVDNLEFRFGDKPIRMRSLELIEQVSTMNPAHVCIISSLDPVLNMESATVENPEHKQELERWIRALAGFERISFDHPYDLQAERVRLAELPKKHYVDCLMIFNREFDRTYYLRRLVPGIMETFDPARCPTPSHFETYIVNRTLQMADGLYRMIWNTLTTDERLVLYQLAADGWVNPLNRVAVAHLVRKRLIFFSGSAGVLKERGALEVMNESFRRFVLAAQDPVEVESWESDDQGILWRGMRLGLLTALVLAAGWVSYIHRELFDASVGYLAAASGGSAAVLKWVVDIVKKPGEKKDAK